MFDLIDNFKKSREYKLNTLYTIAQGTYWMIICCTVSMGSAYLSKRDFSIFTIGLLFALAYFFAAVFQQIISVITDNSLRFTEIDVLVILGSILILDLYLALIAQTKSFISFTFLIAAMVATIVQPFLNALNFHIKRHGFTMNYGVARAAGSFFFFLMSVFIGFFMKTLSVKAAPFLGFLVSILFTSSIIWIFREIRSAKDGKGDEYDPLDEQKSTDCSLKNVNDFIYKNRMFFVFLIGVVCIFFSHIIINNFLYQITVNVGGDEATTGRLLAVQAIVELPAMLFFTQIKEKFSSKILLGTSAIFYLLKIFFTAIASSIGMLYFSMLFQSFAFALFIPASVHFVDEIMSDKDAIKGQAFVTIAMTVSSLIASVCGGFIIKFMGVSATLFFATFVTFVGVIVSILGLVRINTQN